MIRKLIALLFFSGSVLAAGIDPVTQDSNTWTSSQAFMGNVRSRAWDSTSSSFSVTGTGGIWVGTQGYFNTLNVMSATPSQFVKTDGSNNYVSASIQSADIPSNFATKTYVATATTSIPTPDLTPYALKTDVSASTVALRTQLNSVAVATTTMQAQIDLATRARVFSAPGRSLNTVFQPSTTRDTLVSYSVDIAASLSLSGGTTGTVYLRYADNVGFSTNVVEVCRTVNGNTGTLTIGLNITQNATGTLSGMIPAGKYVQIVTENTTGTPTFNYRSGQEVLFE